MRNLGWSLSTRVGRTRTRCPVTSPHFRSSGLGGLRQEPRRLQPARLSLSPICALPSPGNKWWIRPPRLSASPGFGGAPGPPRPLPAVPGDRPHPTLRSSGFPPPPATPTTCSPRWQRGPATVTRDFLFFFCWLQAFFCLSENETDTPASPPADTHTHPHSRTRAAGLPAASVRGGSGSAHTAAGGAGRGAPTLSSARRLPRAPLPAARRPPPGGSAPRPARRSAGCTPRPGTPHGAPAEAARRLCGRLRAPPGRGPRRRAAPPPRAPGLCGSGGSHGAPPEPRGGGSWTPAAPGLRAWRGGGGDEKRATAPALPCFCPACVLAFVLVAITLSQSLSPSCPCPHPVPVVASAQPTDSPEGLRVGFSPRGPRDAGGREEVLGEGTAVGPPSLRNLERSEGSVPSCRAGQKMALAQDRTVRGCPWEWGAWEGRARGGRAPESKSTEGEWSEREDGAKHPALRGESFKHL